ncbi:unnamed protein product [Closterium sp. NIES-53]
MASPNVLTFDAKGRAVDFEVWVDDLQLFLQCDSKDGVSLFDHTSGVVVAPATDADSTVCSQWTTRDAAACLADRSHLPSAERAHFSQYKTARTLYDAIVARYSSPATAALSRLMLPYLFPDLAAFATVADLITHLRTSDTRYRAALPAEFCAAPPPPPMYITLYYLITRLPDSLRSVRDHFLSLCLTTLTVDLLEERLLLAEKSLVAVGASRGDPRAPFFEGQSELRLLQVGGAAAAGARGARVLEGMAGAAVVAVEAVEGVGVEVGVVAVVGASVAMVEVEAAEAPAVGVEVAAAAAEAVGVAAAVVLVGVALCGGEALAVASASSSSALVRPCRPISFVSGTLGVGGLGFPDATEIPRWGDLLKSGVAIFDLDYDAILAAMYAVSISAEGDCYLCVPTDTGIEATSLGASESAAPGAGEAALSGTTSAQVLHTFTLDSGASRSFFRDCTTLSPLSRPVAISLADPSGGPVLAHSTVLPCPAVPSGSLSGLHLPSFSTNLVSGADLQDAWVDQFTLGGQRVTHCSCTRTGRHLATFTRQPGSSLYTQTTMPPPVAESGQVAASGQVFAAASRSGPESAPCSCHLLSHQTLLSHHRLGHPSLPRLRGMASRVLVTGLPRSLPPLPPGPAPTCVPCDERRQRTSPQSSEFPPTEAPLQTLHMDVWGPACVRGRGHERYFLLVVDNYSHYTTVFPLRHKGEVTEVLIDWIRAARRQLSESFGSDLPVLRLHPDRGGEFSSDLLRAFCRAEGIRQTFTLPASPQQNGIAERRIGMYAAHQINLQPWVSVPETTPTLRWTGKVGDASAFHVWGSRAFVRDLSADKLSSRAIPCVFLGFPPDTHGWQFYHPTSRRVLSSQNVTFDESVPYPPVFKARYVARGFSHWLGVDYFHTFSPTPKMTTLRVLLHVAAQRDYELHSLDFSTAFLQGSLHEEIWLRRPPGFTGTTLAALGFAPSTADPSLFLRTDTTLPPFYILVYVDDLVFASADTAGLAHVKSELQKRHTCTDLGELRSYLGLQITRDRARRTITLTLSHMVQQVLQRFNFTYSSPQATPLSTRHSLSALPLDESVEPNGPYPELVGCLIAGPSSGPPSRFRNMGPPLANVQLAPSPLLSQSCQVGHVATNGKQAATTSAVRFALVVSILVRSPVARHGFVPHSARGERAIYRGERASSAQPVMRLVTQQHAQPRVAAACTHARVAVARASSSSTHSSTNSSSGERKYMCTCSSRQRAHRHAHTLQQPAREHTRRTTSGMGLVLGGWGRVVLTGHADASWVDDLATQRSSQGYTFSLGSGSVSWRSTRSSSVLSSSCEAEIYAGAMAAQELRWLTYLLTDLGEAPRSPPVMYVDNKAMLALCQEHRLEHRTKHIALRYFLARELQQPGQRGQHI